MLPIQNLNVPTETSSSQSSLPLAELPPSVASLSVARSFVATAAFLKRACCRSSQLSSNSGIVSRLCFGLFKTPSARQRSNEYADCVSESRARMLFALNPTCIGSPLSANSSHTAPLASKRGLPTLHRRLKKRLSSACSLVSAWPRSPNNKSTSPRYLFHSAEVPTICACSSSSVRA